MPDGYLVRLPPGAGKTRRVWESILRGAGNRSWIWKNRIQGTLVLTPNPRVHRVWLTELALLARNRRMIPGNTFPEDLRTLSAGRLHRLLEPVGIPTLGTFSRFKYGRSRSFRYLILDEWHRLPNAVSDKCKAYSDREKVAGWFIGGKKVKRRVYFVSATPVNPVLEREAEVGELSEMTLDLNDECERITEARHRAADLMGGFIGRRSHVSVKTFKQLLSKLGIYEIASGKRSWRYPKQFVGEPPMDDARLLTTFLQDTRRDNNWVEEYAMAVGLVKTRRKQKRHYLCPSNVSRAKGKCFSVPYCRLYARHGKSRLAEKWLCDQHPRARPLLKMLEAEKVVQRQKDGSYSLSGKKKALVFCTHQGVALGLTHALGSYFGVRRAIRTNVGGRDVEGLTEAFNERSSGLQILVATDALSESIDLHKSCKLVVHYELPWSPLRLLQRVGRLTRLLTDGKGDPSFNKGVRVGHVILPRSVEEERVHRLVRRIRFLYEEGLWPLGATLREIILGLIGSGPSLQLQWELERLNRASFEG
jgi:superfamily II DNA or RNA helicase